MNPRLYLAKSIREAREALGITQKQLAEETGFGSSQIVHQIEKGERDVKAWEFAKIAKVLCLDIHKLLTENTPAAVTRVYWRKAPSLDRKRIEAEFIRKANDYALVEQMCNVTVENKLPSIGSDLADMNFNKAARLGDEIRSKLNLGARPGCCISRTMEEKYGIKIWYKDLGESGSAASAVGDFGMAVLMNSSEASWRCNYSFAHELFHFLTWENYTRLNDEEFDRVERLAECFASSLLLPKEEIVKTLKKRMLDDKLNYDDLIGIAREYDVSAIALLWRMCNIGVIDQDQVKCIIEDEHFIKKNHDLRMTSKGTPPDLPDRFVRLCFRAYQNAKLSRAKLAEFVDTSLIDLPQRLKEYGLSEESASEAGVCTLRR